MPTNGHRFARVFATGMIAAALVAPPALTGCTKPVQQSSGVEMPTVARESQHALAVSALRLIKVHLDAVAQVDAPLANQALDRLIEICDVPTIRKELETNRQIGAVLGKDIVRGLVENWASAVAYYIDGAVLSELSGVLEGANDSIATVNVRARGADGEAIIRVKCAKQTDGQWSLLRIDLAPRRGRSAASQSISR